MKNYSNNKKVENLVDVISRAKFAEEQYKEFARFIGKSLLVLRYKKDMSIGDASYEASISAKELQKIEDGEARFDLEKISTLLSIYNARYYQLF
jgi:predicted transcriptional regulator